MLKETPTTLLRVYGGMLEQVGTVSIVEWACCHATLRRSSALRCWALSDSHRPTETWAAWGCHGYHRLSWKTRWCSSLRLIYIGFVTESLEGISNTQASFLPYCTYHYVLQSPTSTRHFTKNRAHLGFNSILRRVDAHGEPWNW